MVIGLVVAVIAILVAVFVPMYFYRKTSKREKEKSAPILRIPSYRVLIFPGFNFRLKNFGQTSAKKIEFSHNETPLGNFDINQQKTTLAPQEMGGVVFDCRPNKFLLKTYQGKLIVSVSYKSDFSKRETEDFTFYFDNGKLSLLDE